MATNEPQDVLRRILADIAPPQDGDDSLNLSYIDDARHRLPLPYMVFLALTLGTDCRHVSRPSEKTAWSIMLRFKGSLFRLEHGKFGTRMATEGDADDPLAEELVRVLHRAFPLADRVVQPYIEKQMKAGNVTVRNAQHLLRGRYQFFRTEAQRAFARPRPDLGDLFQPPDETASTARTVDLFKAEREGFFYGSAAIDAFFSWLEHILVLILPFVGYDPSKDDLLRFIGSLWGAKVKRVWDLATDGEAKLLYDSLREVKERFRNSVAHGGFEKDGASLYVHLEGLGAVPARLSRFPESIEYGVFPLGETPFSDVCALFERVDTYLRDGPTRYGYRFAESGLDVAFNLESREEYLAATSSGERFADHVERLGYLWETQANMDW